MKLCIRKNDLAVDAGFQYGLFVKRKLPLATAIAQRQSAEDWMTAIFVSVDLIPDIKQTS